jgi:hypothetical protein
MSDRFIEQQINIKFCVELSLEMKHGVFNIIPIANGKDLQWKRLTSPRPKKAPISKSQRNAMLHTFTDIKGTVHFEFSKRPVN